MNLWSEARFAEQKYSQKRRFEKERKNSFHCKRCCDHTARVLGKAGPIGAELKFHRYTSNDTEEKIHREYFRPKLCRSVVAFITGAERERFENDDERREPHRQLWKNIMVGDGEREVETMKRKRAIHVSSLSLPCRYDLAHIATGFWFSLFA